MSSINFNASNETMRQLFGNGVSFRVPSFQRDYSWDEENWEELWDDIMDMYSPDGSSGHYLGYLVLQTEDSRNNIIIDGQQRITTLSILVLAALANFKSMMENGIDAENNRLRMDGIRTSYIGYLNPVTLVPQSRLTLNNHNNRYFQHFMVPLEPLPTSGINASEKLLRKSFFWFKNALAKSFPLDATGGQRLVEFIDGLVDKLFFTVIRVNDELNAFKVFETLNARGVRLSSTDLLKNHFFSIVSDRHDSELASLEESWASILQALSGLNEDFPEFLRVYWNSANPLARKSDLFRVISRSTTTPGQIFETVRRLEACAPVYASLRGQGDDHDWNEAEKEYIAQLRLFNVKQPIAMLLACYSKFYQDQRQEFTGILRDIVSLSFRYNVIMRQAPNDQEKLYNEIARGVMGGELASRRSIKEKLLRIYPDDESFKNAFKKKTFNIGHAQSKKIVRHILARLERQESGHQPDENAATIEHILPVNPGRGWNHVPEQSREDLASRLGNFALLPPGANRDAGNDSYGSKLPFYAASPFITTRNIQIHAPQQWDQSSIDSRQGHMANVACGIWKIH